MAEARLESVILGVRVQVFCVPFVAPIYGGLAYLAPLRWVLMSTSLETSPGAQRIPAGRYGAVKWRNSE